MKIEESKMMTKTYEAIEEMPGMEDNSTKVHGEKESSEELLRPLTRIKNQTIELNSKTWNPLTKQEKELLDDIYSKYSSISAIQFLRKLNFDYFQIKTRR